MSMDQYLSKMQQIQSSLQTFIGDEDNVDENFNSLIKIFEDHQILNDRHEFKSVLCLILKMTDNRFRTQSLINKIERIFDFFKDEIKKNFSNSQIFQIFGKNKRILLYLIKSNIFTIDESIYMQMKGEKNEEYNYLEYFFPEVKTFCEQEFVDNFSSKIQDDFEEKRKEGENDSYICSLVRKDSVEDFISYINRNNYSISEDIPTSIFETHPFLVKNKEVSLIEYAAFFGSVQIFQYLRLNKIEMRPILWLYTIHGRNADLIHILEDNGIQPPENDFKKCLRESLKCYHSELVEYIQNNHIQNGDDEKSIDYLQDIFDFYNFNLMKKEFFNQSTFYILCKNNYYHIVDFLLKTMKIDVNALHEIKTAIKYQLFKYNSKFQFENDVFF